MYTCGQSRVMAYATVSTEGMPVIDNATVIIWHSVQGAFKWQHVSVDLQHFRLDLIVRNVSTTATLRSFIRLYTFDLFPYYLLKGSGAKAATRTRTYDYPTCRFLFKKTVFRVLTSLNATTVSAFIGHNRDELTGRGYLLRASLEAAADVRKTGHRLHGKVRYLSYHMGGQYNALFSL